MPRVRTVNIVLVGVPATRPARRNARQDDPLYGAAAT